MAKRTDKVTYEQRLTVVMGMIARGMSSQRIVQVVSVNWDIAIRTAWGYLRTARNRMADLVAHKREHLLEEILSRHDDLREKGYTGGDLRLVLDTDKEDAKLLGLYPAEKHEHDIRGIDDAIARELALLAGRAEASDAGETEGA